MSATPYAVTHDDQAHRFTVVKDGLTAELNYRMAGNRMIITHIGVSRALEGRGIGSALAEAGLAHAQQQALEVLPLCSFARRYIERTPEYQPLVSKSFDGGE